MKLKTALTVLLVVLGLASARAQSSPEALEADIAQLQHGWAQAFYTVAEPQKEDAFKTLAEQAAQLSARHAGRAEPLVWEAIILSSYAKFEGGLGALDKIKRARKLLLAAESLNPEALDGSIYTSLGSLYAKSPGWPLAFGDKKKAREYLERALTLNPEGIDPNFFLGELLLDQGDKVGARRHLDRALQAPPRPGREDADAGRREEVRALLAKLG